MVASAPAGDSSDATPRAGRPSPVEAVGPQRFNAESLAYGNALRYTRQRSTSQHHLQTTNWQRAGRCSAGVAPQQLSANQASRHDTPWELLRKIGFPEALEEKSTRSCPVNWTEEGYACILAANSRGAVRRAALLYGRSGRDVRRGRDSRWRVRRLTCHSR